MSIRAAFRVERGDFTLAVDLELPADLDGPRRALTTVLNARLIPMIDRLIRSTRSMLADAGIDAPLMVVRGDGALVSAEFAMQRPIETILSGPAASLVGAAALTGEANAIVCDIGGTTSDIAVLQDGQPRLDARGALVGSYRTMVRAVAMQTFGLGGDSEVGLGGTALSPELTLGPRRLMPVSLLATEHRDFVHTVLDAQAKASLPVRNEGRFAMVTRAGTIAGLSPNERRLLDRLGDKPAALSDLLQGTAEQAALDRLVARGLVMLVGVTPSDALHVLGDQTGWDEAAARKALTLFARRRDGRGQSVGTDADSLARTIVRRVHRLSAERILQSAFDHDGFDGAALVKEPAIASTMSARADSEGLSGMVQLGLHLDRPVIGLGASAGIYHPPAGVLLDTPVLVPDHADVANAYGAVVGQINMRVEIIVTQPQDGRFTLSDRSDLLLDEGKALEAAQQAASEHAERQARESGAENVELRVQTAMKRAEIEGRDTLVEARIVATASGRPAIAH